MQHETPVITAERRERVGSRYARRLRDQGRLPAVIYGHQTEPVHVSIDEKEILTLLHHGAHVMEVQMDGSSETCLVKDLQFGYLGDDVIHVDFARVDLQEQVTVNVHLHFAGAPAEAQRAGAILRHDHTELTVTCRVASIPEEIKVDLSKMEGTQLTAREIPLPAGLELAEDPHAVIASIGFVRAMEAEVGEEAEVEAAEGEPEVISAARQEEQAGQEEGEEGS